MTLFAARINADYQNNNTKHKRKKSKRNTEHRRSIVTNTRRISSKELLHMDFPCYYITWYYMAGVV